MDADVIKTYVELEMGIGIIASVAWDDERDTKLRVIDAGHLFEINTTRLGIARNHWLPGFAYAFIETFVPSLTPEVIQQIMSETTTTLKKISI
jgi:LysR family transcriptional regulator, cys regulon transcriptional activator